MAFGTVLICAAALTGTATVPQVGKPPESFFEKVAERDREAARKFYGKHLSIGGLAVVASSVVDDRALIRTREIVLGMLGGRPDVLEAMAKNRMYLIIIGKDQVYTDMPEYRNTPDPAYMNERVRGTGGRPTSFGEENLLSLPIDRYDDESIAVHEFLHTIDSTLATIDSAWQGRKNQAYRNALAKGLYKNTYAAGNASEFWAEAAQAYFDCNRVNNWNHGPVGNRAQLKAYDPETYELVESTFKLGANDWRYAWLQKLPNVQPPPPQFKIDPYYTKHTWAREFNVVGREASDSAMLQVNEVIRKLFAYRHDVLKSMIASGMKVVVLGPKEKSESLPEFKPGGDTDLASKTIVVEQAQLEKDGGAMLIGQMARGMFITTAYRPVDPNWGNRGRNVQQYELRVQRLDERFGKAVRDLLQASGRRESAETFWANGVSAYFDAGGSTMRTRSELKAQLPDLYKLVADTMAYEDKVDWRLPVRRAKGIANHHVFPLDDR